MTLRIVFMGTPAFAVPTLRALALAGHEIAAVYTQPPRAAGRRGLEAMPSPVAVEAGRLGVGAILTPLSLKREPDAAARLREFRADLGIVVAYGMLLPQDALDAPRFGCLNAHASLLPRWRGAAPIQRAIEAGDRTTGTMVMCMEAGLDTGPVAATRETPVGTSETAGDLHDRLALLSAEVMVEVVAGIETGTVRFEPQEEIAARTGRKLSYARKIEKSETFVDFSGDGAATAARINAFSPFPGAWTTFEADTGPERVKLLRAVPAAGDGAAGTLLDAEGLVACGGGGAVRLMVIQRAGGRPLAAAEFGRGARLAAGMRIGGGDAPL